MQINDYDTVDFCRKNINMLSADSVILIQEYMRRWCINEHDNCPMYPYCLYRCTFTVEPSFVVCENLKFGRRSFKGFNPEIEVHYKSYHAYHVTLLYFHYTVVRWWPVAQCVFCCYKLLMWICCIVFTWLLFFCYAWITICGVKILFIIWVCSIL